MWVGTSQNYVGGEWYDSIETPYVHSNKQNHITVQYNTDPPLNLHEYIQTTVHHLININIESRIYPIIGWFCATLFKSRIKEEQASFPILNLYGTSGAGKTQTIFILQRLACYTQTRTYDCFSTNFILSTLLSSTTDVPVSLSEYRESDVKGMRGVQRLLLLSYDRGVAPRGHQNQAVSSYRLTAPVTVDGEDAISDTALKERCLQVLMSKTEIDQYREEHFDALSGLDLSVLGTRLLEYSMKKDFSLYLDKARGLCDLQMSSRVQSNVEISIAGLLFFRDFVMDHGIGFEIDCTWFENMVIEQENEYTIVDTFIENIINDIAHKSRNLDFKYKIDEQDNILWFHYGPAYNYWREKYGKHQTGSHSMKAIKTQLRERQVEDNDKHYVLHARTQNISGSSFHCYGINITKAQQFGLDIPTKLKKHPTVTMKKRK